MWAGEARPGFRRAPHATPRAALALAQIAAPDARLWYRQPFAPGGNRDTCVERIPLMNPADVAPAALPLVSADVSLIALFMQAHWVVKTVMLGLLACSVWVWAIAIDKIFLYGRTKRAMDRFEQAFWSGQSIEELYRALSAKPTQSMAACFVAAMREWKRSFESQTRSFAGLQMRIEKVMNVSIAREVERLERRLFVLAPLRPARPLFAPFRTVWGLISSFHSTAAPQ